MSKKQAKPAKKKPAKNKPAKKTAVKKAPAKAATRRAPAMARVADLAPSNRTAAATIFVYSVNDAIRARTSPQLITAGPGYIEWTVVNLSSGDNNVPVEISWPSGGPWGDQPIAIKNGNARLSLATAKDGRYKYNVTVGGFIEDPEIEIPEM